MPDKWQASLAVFIAEALCVWTNLGKHSLFFWLFVSSVKTGTRRIIRPDELSSVVRRWSRIIRPLLAQFACLELAHYGTYSLRLSVFSRTCLWCFRERRNALTKNLTSYLENTSIKSITQSSDGNQSNIWYFKRLQFLVQVIFKKSNIFVINDFSTMLFHRNNYGQIISN